MTKVDFINLNPPKAEFLDDILTGLKASPKYLLPKYFYDQTGSQIFDEICTLEEYYPTRTEVSILKKFKNEIRNKFTGDTALIEFGSGSSIKIRHLVENNEKIKSYIPIDISKEHLLEAAESFHRLHPNIDVLAICADYTQIQKLPEHKFIRNLNKSVFFPGSTLGNLEESEAARLLRNTRNMVGEGGQLILGIDLLKDEDVLKAAYSDEKGITAAFNKNILKRMNEELQANFQPDDFDHEARFNEKLNRVEMHLVALRDLEVNIKNDRFKFKKGESIHTESSHKYDLKRFTNFAKSCGFEIDETYLDDNKYFAVCLMKAIS